MTLFEMSVSGAVLIAVILLLHHGLLYRLPKWTFLLLWGVALCRLLIPFSLPSPVSVYTGAARAAQAIQKEQPSPPPLEGLVMDPSSPLPQVPSENAGTPAPPPAPAEEPVSLLSALRLAGTALCALLFAAAYGRSLLRFRSALPAEDEFIARWQKEHPTLFPTRVSVSSAVNAPLAYGLLRPTILLPQNTNRADREQLIYILTHEYVHIRRGDLLWKLLLTAALCLHWFNPLVWAMYFCANRDLELACDEAVVRILGPDSRKGYAYTLLAGEWDCPLPLFSSYRSKNSMEERIIAIVRTKKQSLTLLLASLLLVAAVAVLFATSRAVPSAGWSEKVEVWVDYYGQDDILWDRHETLELEEFPGVVFTWTPGGVTAKTEEGEMTLFTGMPVYNVFLRDLTGDGLPEFCATAAFGSGMIDYHVLVCDYAAAARNPRPDADEGINIAIGQAQYVLWERGEYDYVLSLEDGRLRVTRAQYPVLPGQMPSGAEAGDLVLTADGTLSAIQWDHDIVDTQDADAGGAVHSPEPSSVVPDQIDGVWMELVEGSLSPSGLEYTVHNENKGRRLTYGADFCLQVEENGSWYALTPLEEPFFTAIGYELDGDRATEHSRTINWSLLYGELPPGRYRMLKRAIWSGAIMNPVLALEFVIEA